MAEIQLPQVHQALQTLDLGQPVALQEGESTAVRAVQGQDQRADGKEGVSSSRAVAIGRRTKDGPEQKRRSESWSAALAKIHVVGKRLFG